ncbi:MAG: cation-transporting P-type ATPase [Deltaproteobacteria bacterium]|jgi:potassium/sodium efflux P-type ATPase|nr:cation-transporting P-type ATPase [Deltaproteobacteria bacterium]
MEKETKFQQPQTKWYSLEAEIALSRLSSGTSGLETAEAENRLKQYGPNRLSPPRKRSTLERFAAQFHNVLIYVLLAAGILTAFLGHWIDAGVIIGVVLINAVIGFIQEGKAEKALEAIRSMLSHQATVLREGRRSVLPAERLVPGDLVIIQSGDKVPADLRLLKAKDLHIDEAALTGESVPVDKDISPLPENLSVGDRKCMAYSGTLVTYGQGTGIVVGTGDNTEIGRINLMLSKVQPLTTRLLKQMADFGQLLTGAIVVLAVITFIFGIIVRDYSFTEMFLACVGLAVAAIPEGLPAIVTITLAIGVQRMARRNAIIRRLPAVETLGSVTVICSDKTGTLTLNEMTVQTVATADYEFSVSGGGYEPKGGFTVDNEIAKPLEYPELQEIARAAVLCNDANVSEIDGRWEMQGDPTEGALVVLGMKAGAAPDRAVEEFPRVDVIPFESEHRFMATLHDDQGKHRFIYVKGAPEKVLKMCTKQRSFGEDKPIDETYWHEKFEAIASKGQRILAIAFRSVENTRQELKFSDVSEGMTLLGLCGIIDPPREEAVKAIVRCRSAGICVKMITGDHIATARAIGAQMGIGDGVSAITGETLEGMSDLEIRDTARRVEVFARVSPEHKLRLVQALQAEGAVVAMTGDGVNDAPALKRADVGVAMGIKGTEVAKESAEMVLTDDNFASIAQAVEEGRTVYDNIKKAITFILPTNGGEAGIIIAAILSGRMLPITPVQILWVNMITAVTLALSLAFEPPEPGVMKRPPRSPKEPLLSYFLFWRIVFVSLILVVGTFGLFLWDRLHDVSIESSRAVAVNTLVMFEVFYLLNSRYLKTSVLSREGLLGNGFAIIAIVVVITIQLLFTYTAPMQKLFGVAAVSPMDWVRIISVATTVFILVEAEKYILNMRESRIKKIPVTVVGCQ